MSEPAPTRFYRDREATAAAVDKLKVFAQPQRLMILSCLLDAERNVGEIAEATGIAQPALSQQLAELRRAALVRTRKEVKQVWYALADAGVEQCVRHMEAIFGNAAPQGDAVLARGPALRSGATPIPPAPSAVPQGVAGFARII